MACIIPNELRLENLRKLGSEFCDLGMNISSPSNFRRRQNLSVILKFVFLKNAIIKFNSIWFGIMAAFFFFDFFLVLGSSQNLLKRKF